jgi:hypothetical protein
VLRTFYLLANGWTELASYQTRTAPKRMSPAADGRGYDGGLAADPWPPAGRLAGRPCPPTLPPRSLTATTAQRSHTRPLLIRLNALINGASAHCCPRIRWVERRANGKASSVMQHAYVGNRGAFVR